MKRLFDNVISVFVVVIVLFLLIPLPPFLLDVLETGGEALVLVGPEGDFSLDEVRLALANGFRSVSLGRSRLRTETAALVAVHLMHIRHAI